VCDGNFKADHMRMKNPENDVILGDGQGYFVASKPYKQHLLHARNIKTMRIPLF
jgi:hypothetical protein